MPTSNEKDSDCKECNYNVSVGLTETICDDFPEENKKICKDIIKEVKKNKKTLKQAIDEISEKLQLGTETLEVIKQIAKENDLL